MGVGAEERREIDRMSAARAASWRILDALEAKVAPG
jgi:hypothetical protein